MYNNDIQTRPFPACPVCGARGSPFYRGLSDQVFNASGLWNMSKCSNPGCGTLWLDPMPAEADLPKLYAGYYTHQSPSRRAGGRLWAVMERVRAAYLHARYGYAPLSRSLIDKLLGLAPYLHPVWKDNLDASVFHLQAKPGGRLLEIGCGSGAALELMQKKGWEVTGLDFDEGAVSNARSKGLDVRLGQLFEQQLPDESFDAVVMSHVIEHVPMPAELLVECWRILKKNGTMVAITPNADSEMHRRYGRNWRGLEPPRHLQIFTPDALRDLAYRAGYETIECFTSMQGAIYIQQASAELARHGHHDMNSSVSLGQRVMLQLAGLLMGWRNVLSPGYGVIAVLMCKK